MKLNEQQYSKLLEIVKEEIERASLQLGISFYVEKYYLYGSQLTEKEKPNDIDIFVYATEWEDDSGEYNDDIEMYQALYDYLHENQPVYFNTPIDINIKSYDFDLDGKVHKLES